MAQVAPKRKQAHDKDGSKKPKAADGEEPFGVVWTDGEQRFPICFCSSHEDGQRKVDALTAEGRAFIDAGGDLRGDEDNIYWYYTTTDGKAWVWDKEKKQATRPAFRCAPGEKFHVLRDSLEGKEVCVPERNVPRPGTEEASKMLGATKTGSMAFSASECGSGAVYRKFWHIIRRQPYYILEVLRSIYKAGHDYNTVPSEEELDRHRQENGDDGDEKEDEEESDEK